MFNIYRSTCFHLRPIQMNFKNLFLKNENINYGNSFTKFTKVRKYSSSLHNNLISNKSGIINSVPIFTVPTTTIRNICVCCTTITTTVIYKKEQNSVFGMIKRNKMVKTSSYRRKSRSSPYGQGQKAKIGIKRLSGEYVRTGQMLVKQRKIIAFNYERKTRKRNFKYYPGENVKVSNNTSLIALTDGRVKYTFHVLQNIMIVNVIPEELEELKEEDLYRYRTEHVQSFEENRSLIYLRMKNNHMFPKFQKTQYIKPPLKPQFLTKYDIYDNPTLKEVPLLYHKRR